MNLFDEQYKTITKSILENGTDRMDRTGIGSRAIWGQSMTINLADGFPCSTLRKVSPRIAFEETMFFLRGETNTKLLEEKNINIWKANTSRDFLDKRGLNELPEGDMGKGYGFQWRHFNGNKASAGVDQVIEVLENLKTNPNDRRHVITAWNPSQLPETALPPCHILQQYQISDGKLNSLFFMRSSDFLYGCPFNVMGYAFLNIIFSKYLGIEPGILVYFAGDVHLYSNQIEMATMLLERKSFHLPSININKKISSIDDIFLLTYDNIEITNYECHPDFKNKPKMAV